MSDQEDTSATKDKESAPQCQHCSALELEMAERQRAFDQRELELTSIVECCKKAFEEEKERSLEELKNTVEADVKRKDALLTQLQELMGESDQKLGEMAMKLETYKRDKEDALREQKKQFLIREGELRAEMSRHLLDKEKQRFENQVISTALDTERTLRQSDAHRAAGGLSAVTTKAAGAFQDTEASQRRAMEELQHSQAECIRDFLDSLTELQKAGASRAKAERQRVVYAVQRGIALSSNAPPVDEQQQKEEEGNEKISDSIDDGEDEEASGVSTVVHKELSTRDRTITECQADNSQLRGLLHDMEMAISQRELSMDNLRHSLEDRIHVLHATCESLSKQLELLRGQVHDSTARKATDKAQDAILEEMVAQSGEERAEMRQLISTLQEELTVCKHTNKIQEAEDLKARLRTTSSDLQRSQSELVTLRARAMELDHVAASADTTISQLKIQLGSSQTDNQRLHGEIDSLHEAHRKELEGIGSEIQQLRQENSKSTSVHTELRSRIDALNNEVARLERFNKTLEEKYISTFHDVAEDPLPWHFVGRTTTTPPDDMPPQQKNEQRSPRDTSSKNTTPRTGARAATPTTQQQQQQRQEQEHINNVKALSPNVSEPPTATVPETEYIKLQERMLMLRRERDALRYQLDQAHAQVSVSEERAARTTEKYLAIISANDAAPKREQNMLHRSYELSKVEKSLEEKDKVLQYRFGELEKKEKAINRSIAKYQARGVNLLQVESGGRHFAFSATPRSDDGSLSNSYTASGIAGSIGGTGGGLGGPHVSQTYYNPPTRLAPIAHRPPIVFGSTDNSVPLTENNPPVTTTTITTASSLSGVGGASMVQHNESTGTPQETSLTPSRQQAPQRSYMATTGAKVAAMQDISRITSVGPNTTSDASLLSEDISERESGKDSK